MSSQDNSFSTIKCVVARGAAFPPLTAVAVFAIFGWFGWKTAMIELWILGLVFACVAAFVVKLAVEIVVLVADTLMPR